MNIHRRPLGRRSRPAFAKQTPPLLVEHVHMSPEALFIAVLVLGAESLALFATLARESLGRLITRQGHTGARMTALCSVLAETVRAVVLLPVRSVQVRLLRLHGETTLSHHSWVKVRVSPVIFHLQLVDRFVLGGQTARHGALGLPIETNAGATVLPPSVSIATQFAVRQLSTAEDGTTVSRSTHIPIYHSRHEPWFTLWGYAGTGVAHALGLSAAEFDE